MEIKGVDAVLLSSGTSVLLKGTMLMVHESLLEENEPPTFWFQAQIFQYHIPPLLKLIAVVLSTASSVYFGLQSVVSLPNLNNSPK